MLHCHCVGTIDYCRDRLNKWLSGSATEGAASWRNQCGSGSSKKGMQRKTGKGKKKRGRYRVLSPFILQ